MYIFSNHTIYGLFNNKYSCPCSIGLNYLSFYVLRLAKLEAHDSQLFMANYLGHISFL